MEHEYCTVKNSGQGGDLSIKVAAGEISFYNVQPMPPGSFFLYAPNKTEPCFEVSGDGTLKKFDLEKLKAVAAMDESAGCFARALLAVYTQGKLEN